MGLQIKMDNWDYQTAIIGVEGLLLRITTCPDGKGGAILKGIPSGKEIVDFIWNKIK